MSENWYWLIFGVELGPMMLEDLRLLAEQGCLLPDSQVREGATGSWKRATMIPELFKTDDPTASGAAADGDLSAPLCILRPKDAEVQQAARKPRLDTPPTRKNGGARF